MTRWLISIIALLAWALWFGAVIALFVFVVTLFHNNHDIAVQAAPQLFAAFVKYHLVLAAIALIATILWQLAAPSKLLVINFILLLLAAICGLVLMVWFIKPMNALLAQGLSGSDEFKKLHGQSMTFFLAQSIALLVYGIILPFAMRGDARTLSETAAVRDSRA